MRIQRVMEDDACDTSMKCAGECKDDNNLMTQIAFVILLVYSLYLLWRNIKNLLHLRDQRKKMRVYKLLIINLVVFIFLIGKLQTYPKIQVLKRISCFMEMALFHYLQIMDTSTLKDLIQLKNLLLVFSKSLLLSDTIIGRQKFSSLSNHYRSALFATVYDKPKETVRRVAMGIAAFFVLLFSCFFIFFCIYFSAVGVKADGQADFA